MNIKDLMSGIGVVIDDAYRKNSSDEGRDKIFELVKGIKDEWEIPFCTYHKIPSDNVCDNFLRSASFILLDWKLWPNGAAELEKSGTKENIKLLEKSKDYFIPVFIFTNENVDDVTSKLGNLYDENNLGRNFIFIKNKSDLISSGIIKKVSSWICENASVYTLKAWERAFSEAKINLFSSMYEKSPDWPKIFWKSYKDDGVDPRSSIVGLINDSLFGRINAGNFRSDVFDEDGGDSNVCKGDLQSVLEGMSFIQNNDIDENEIRAGDLFKIEEKYFINIRPDCDCIPRDSNNADGIKLYCLEGRELGENKIKENYNRKLENFREVPSKAFVFPVNGGKVVQVEFPELKIFEFSELKENRVGRLIHPYITKIQQRYALYLQRQGLPRIPKKAIL